MRRLAIWGSESLVGQELKDALARRHELWDDLKLVGPESDSSVVSEIGGQAALILPATAENLAGVDLLFCCDASDPFELPAGLPEKTTTLVVPAGEPIARLPVIVAGVNSEIAAGPDRPPALQSAHPAAVALAHLLAPLHALGLESCAASVILPSSTRGQEGIDGLLEETRSILAFQPRSEESIFDHQIAFNIAPGVPSGRRIAESVREVLGAASVRIAAQTSIGGVFHGLLAGAYVSFSEPLAEAALRDALSGSPRIEFSDRPETLGPVDVAGSSSLRLGAIEATAESGSFWLRAVMDNITTGGAHNVIGIAEAILEADSASGYTM